MPPPVTVTPGPLSLQTPAPLQIARYVRNGLVPHALFETDAGASLNFVAASRTKELFRYYGNVASINSGTIVARTRWRFASHTGPVLRRIRAIVMMAHQSHGTAGSPSATLYITDASGGTVYGSGSWSFGASATGVGDFPSEFGVGEIIIGGVPADTDIYGRFEDSQDARLISACVFEESKKVLAGNGYVLPSQVAALGPIYDDRREDMYELATTLWKRGAAQLFNWTANLGATGVSTTSATLTNIVDNSSTAVAASTPGYTLDLRYCRTRALATVPCKLVCYGEWVKGASVNTAGGTVAIKDSGGNTIGSIANGWTDTAPGWASTTINMPATNEKFDVMYASDSGNGSFELAAVSLFQYA